MEFTLREGLYFYRYIIFNRMPDPIPELCRLLAVSINIPVTQISIQKYTLQNVSDPYNSVGDE